jgi:hypothetical protein
LFVCEIGSCYVAQAGLELAGMLVLNKQSQAGMVPLACNPKVYGNKKMEVGNQPKKVKKKKG